MKLSIISGASRGLGLDLARHLIDAGHEVINLSRSEGPRIGGMTHFSMDLNELQSIGEIFRYALASVDLVACEEINLINNAAVIYPLGRVEDLDPQEVAMNININLTSVILMCGQFLRITEGVSGRRTVVNVTSGVARNPKTDWAPYSAAKAGVENLSETIRRENGSNLRVVDFNPGIMDTDMQADIRRGDFDGVEDFHKYHAEGALRSTRIVADALVRILTDRRYQNAYYNIVDML